MHKGTVKILQTGVFKGHMSETLSRRKEREQT